MLFVMSLEEPSNEKSNCEARGCSWASRRHRRSGWDALAVRLTMTQVRYLSNSCEHPLSSCDRPVRYSWLYQF